MDVGFSVKEVVSRYSGDLHMIDLLWQWKEYWTGVGQLAVEEMLKTMRSNMELRYGQQIGGESVERFRIEYEYWRSAGLTQRTWVTIREQFREALTVRPTKLLRDSILKRIKDADITTRIALNIIGFFLDHSPTAYHTADQILPRDLKMASEGAFALLALLKSAMSTEVPNPFTLVGELIKIGVANEVAKVAKGVPRYDVVWGLLGEPNLSEGFLYKPSYVPLTTLFSSMPSEVQAQCLRVVADTVASESDGIPGLAKLQGAEMPEAIPGLVGVSTWCPDGAKEAVGFVAVNPLRRDEVKDFMATWNKGQQLGSASIASSPFPDVQVGERIVIQLTAESASKSGHIPIPQNRRWFFPPSGEMFLLLSDIDPIETRVEKKRRHRGQKLQGRRITKGLKPWFDRHPEVSQGARLQMTYVGYNRYELEVLPNGPLNTTQQPGTGER